jgi:hypothetical protein
MRRHGPDPKGAAKGSGDVHQPDLDELAGRNRDGRPVAVDSDEPLADSGPAREDEATPGKGINQAGYLKDKDAPGMGGGGSRSS